MSNENRSNSELHLTEWTGLMLLCGLLVLVVTTVVYQRYRSQVPVSDSSGCPLVSNRQMTVCISGAVQHPGRYQLREGSTVKDLVIAAGQLAHSDIDGIDMDERLHSRQHIRLSELHWITVYVEGAAAEPGAVTLPAGSTVGDLLKHLTLNHQAQTRGLRRRERLQDGQTIVIPQRQRRQESSTNRY